MKWWKIALGLFLAAGLGVAVLSLYKASIDGLMKNVGLVGNDFDASILREKISTVIIETRGTVACDLPTRLKGAVMFLLSGDEKQGALAFQLGNSRIVCGAQMLSDGRAEVGTYEVLKGMGYLKQGYVFVQERAEVDSRVCQYIQEADLSLTVASILEATSGKVYELIWNDWQKVIELRTPVDAHCLDQRNLTR